MILDLDKQDLVNIIQGCNFSYKALDNQKIRNHYTTDDRKSFWIGLEKLSENELIEIYKIIKSCK